MKFNLLSNPTTNYKANKNITIGYNTYFLSLAHSDISGYNVCPFANKLKAKENNKNKSSCSSVCVGYNGFAQIFKSVMKARIRKTKLYFENRELFFNQLIQDIEKAIKQSIKAGKIPTFRLNAYSDIMFEKIKIKHNNKMYMNAYFSNFAVRPYALYFEPDHSPLREYHYINNIKYILKILI